MSHELRAEGLNVHYGKATAVRDVDLTIPSGVITGLVGPNGAGKSSVLLAMYGAVASTGKVLLDGDDISGVRSAVRARRGVSIVPQGRQLFPRLTVRDNLKVMAQTLGLANDRIDGAMERFPILKTRAKSYAGVLSGGEQQMLVVARALMSDPKVLLLDEAATGLAPIIVEEIGRTAVSLAKDGVAVIVAAPEIGALTAVIQRGYVMIRGEIVATEEGGGAALNQVYQSAMGVDLSTAT